jgi:hypothetical protein
MTIFLHNVKSYTDVILSSHLSKRLEEKNQFTDSLKKSIMKRNQTVTK